MSELESALAGLRIEVERRELGRYRLRYRVAQGGMGAVYLAQLVGEAGFSRWVAIKVIHAHAQHDPTLVSLFLDEARLVAQLDHPNVCRVTDFGDASGTWFLAMEYLHGEPFHAVIQEALDRGGGLPLAIAARIVADAARGLHHAHELLGPDGLPAHVVHRDVSPHNIMVLYDGVAKVVDFGIAQSRARLSEKTREGTLRGKLAYMAPEQLKSGEIDRRVDVFALGVVLWEATVGRRLFKAASEAQVVTAILQGAPAPSTRREGYPPALEAIVMRALASDPNERYPTADALARDLDRWVTSTAAMVGPAELRDYLCALMPERKGWRDTLLRAEAWQEVSRPTSAARDAARVGDAAIEGPGTHDEQRTRVDRVDALERSTAAPAENTGLGREPSGPRGWASLPRVLGLVFLATMIAGLFVARPRSNQRRDLGDGATSAAARPHEAPHALVSALSPEASRDSDLPAVATAPPGGSAARGVPVAAAASSEPAPTRREGSPHGSLSIRGRTATRNAAAASSGPPPSSTAQPSARQTPSSRPSWADPTWHP